MSFNGDLYPTAGADVVMSTKGDIVRYDSERERYAIGSTNQVLSVTAGLPAWKTLTTADSVLTTQGSILYENASGLAELGFGTTGDVLTTKGTGANPAWETPATGLSSPLSSNLVWDDNVEANFGTGGGDSKIYHDGSHWYFDPVTGYSIWNGSFTMATGQCMTNNSADVTIASGLITGTSNTMRLDTEGAGATDDLDSANFGALDVTGAYFSLLTQNDSRDVTVKDQSVSPFFLMPSDFTLDTTQDILYFSSLNGRTHNHEISRSNNS